MDLLPWLIWRAQQDQAEVALYQSLGAKIGEPYQQAVSFSDIHLSESTYISFTPNVLFLSYLIIDHVL